MKEIIITFVQDLLENNRIPVHIVTLPCKTDTWLDCGLRSDILPNHKPDHINEQLRNC